MTVRVKKNVDVAIIGSGTAGMGAYRAALKHTDSIALIEGGAYGTTCARVGCMPSKLLIAAANAAHEANSTEQFGISTQSVTVDGQAVMQRVRSERDRFVGFVLESVEQFDDAHKIQGFASFVDNHTLEIDDHTLIEADRIVIATGSHPVYPAILAEADDRLLTNDSLFELTDLPDSVAVFGPGVIGLELGQALHRLGVQVKIFGRNGSVATLTDDAIRRYAQNTFAQEFYLDTESNVTNIRRVTEGVQLTYLNKQGETTEETFDYLLAATGRNPNVLSLGLENTEVSLNEFGIPYFDAYTLQTSADHIFIAGDVNNELTLLHEAADEGRIAGDNAGRYPDIRAGHRSASLGIVFTEPQIMTVGERAIDIHQRRPNCFAMGEVDFKGQGRSRVMGKNEGMLRVYAEQGTGTFIGAEMFGPSAEHIGHLLAWALQQKLTVQDILEMPFYHPVVEEGVRTAFRDVRAKLHLGEEMIQHCLDCGPGA